MKLKFIDIDLNKQKPKATIHASGKLGFNMEAIEFMKLENKNSYQIALDEENTKVIYLVETEDTNNSAKVAKAGAYYYLNAGDAFERLGFKYTEYTIMFDISKDRYEDKDLYVLKQVREIKRKDKDEKEEDTI